MPAIPRSAQIDIRSVSMPKILWFPNGRSNNIVQRVNHYRGRYCGLTYEARQPSWSARIVCDWMNNRDLAHTSLPSHQPIRPITLQKACHCTTYPTQAFLTPRRVVASAPSSLSSRPLLTQLFHGGGVVAGRGEDTPPP